MYEVIIILDICIEFGANGSLALFHWKKKIYAPNNDQSLQCTSERLTETLRSPWITDDRRGEDLQTRQPGSTHSEGTVNVFFSDALSH